MTAGFEVIWSEKSERAVQKQLSDLSMELQIELATQFPRVGLRGGGWWVDNWRKFGTPGGGMPLEVWDKPWGTRGGR